MAMLQLVSQLYKQATTAEKELSKLNKIFADVEVMLQEHIKDINKID